MAAAEFDPTRPTEVDPEGVHFRYPGTLVPGNCRLRKELTQVAAAQWAAKCDSPVIRRGMAATMAVPLTTSWLLNPNQGRNALGEAIAMIMMPIASLKRQVLQFIAGMYPGNALLHRWGIAPS